MDYEWISTKEAAQLLGVSDQTIRKFLKQGHFVGHRLTRNWKVSKNSLEEFIQNHNETSFGNKYGSYEE